MRGGFYTRGRRTGLGLSEGLYRPDLENDPEHAHGALAGQGPADLEASATAADPSLFLFSS